MFRSAISRSSTGVTSGRSAFGDTPLVAACAVGPAVSGSGAQGGMARRHHRGAAPDQQHEDRQHDPDAGLVAGQARRQAQAIGGGADRQDGLRLPRQRGDLGQRRRAVGGEDAGGDPGADQPIGCAGDVQAPRHDQRAADLVGAIAWLDAGDRRDQQLAADHQRVRAGRRHRRAQDRGGGRVQQRHHAPGLLVDLGQRDQLARLRAEAELVGGQIAHRLLVGGHRPRQARQLRQRRGARLDGGGQLALLDVELVGGGPQRSRAFVAERRSPGDEEDRDQQATACQGDARTVPSHAGLRTCPIGPIFRFG